MNYEQNAINLLWKIHSSKQDGVVFLSSLPQKKQNTKKPTRFNRSWQQDKSEEGFTRW